MKGKFWNSEENLPEPKLQEFLDEKLYQHREELKKLLVLI